MSYEPQSAEPPSMESIDMTMFNPIFVHCAEQEMQKRGDKKEGQGKQKEKKKRAKVVMLFEDDEGMALVNTPQQGVDKRQGQGQSAQNEAL